MADVTNSNNDMEDIVLDLEPFVPIATNDSDELNNMVVDDDIEEVSVTSENVNNITTTTTTTTTPTTTSKHDENKTNSIQTSDNSPSKKKKEEYSYEIAISNRAKSNLDVKHSLISVLSPLHEAEIYHEDNSRATLILAQHQRIIGLEQELKQAWEIIEKLREKLKSH